MLLTFVGVRWILRRIGAWDTETREPDWGRSRPSMISTPCLVPWELVDVEDRGHEEVPNDDEHDQTGGNDRTGGSVSAGQTAALTATAGAGRPEPGVGRCTSASTRPPWHGWRKALGG